MIIYLFTDVKLQRKRATNSDGESDDSDGGWVNNTKQKKRRKLPAGFSSDSDTDNPTVTVGRYFMFYDYHHFICQCYTYKN